jgi:SAM-dependent methyltransferase
MPSVTPGDRWLSTLWPLVRTRLPDPPAQVLEIGCGRLGGFVPMLRSQGYEATGIDPEAPAGPHYQRIEFELGELPRPVDAVIACTSLHHVLDPAEVIERMIATLTSDGAIVVVEWAWEAFDEQTAAWCFERLGSGGAEGWLHRHRDRWLTSGQEWPQYLREWAEQEGLHSADLLIGLLEKRLTRERLVNGPYFFPDLPDTSEVEEQAAIDAQEIRATRIDWAGVLR